MYSRLKQDDGAALALKALELMELRHIPPTASNYEIWLTHLLGENNALSAEIDAIEADGKEFTDSVCGELYADFFTNSQLENELLRTGSAMSDELDMVQRRLEEAGRNTAAYGRALEGARGKIETADAERLQALIGVLVQATHRMRQHTEILEGQLSETSKEVRDLRSNLEVVRLQAMTDALTGVANRKRLEEMLREGVESARVEGLPLSIAICDIDHFKRFNDTWGHQTGDQIIKFVAQSLTSAAGGRGEVGRYGGEEFVIIMSGAALNDGVEISEEARQIIEKKRLLRRSTNEDLGTVTISCGVAELRAGEDERDLIARADTLLYQAKNSGRNQVCHIEAAGGAKAA